MPGLVFTSYPLQQEAWGMLRHSEKIQFHPLAIADSYCGRISNGILNSGLAAIGREFEVLFDGELLNREELWSALHRGSGRIPDLDQELLVGLLDEGCELNAIVSQADGAFTMLVHEPLLRRIRVANDRFGLRPHYWAKSGGNFVFAPEVKFCVSQSWLDADFDPLSIAEYFNFQCVMEERTLFRGVQVFPAGSIGTYALESGSWDIRPYGDWSDLVGEPYQGSFDEAVEEATTLFRAAIVAATQGKHRHGIYLSGGLDSRQILAALSATADVPTFSFGPAGSPDILYARQCARIAGTDHHEFLMENGRWLQEIATQHTQLSEGFHCLWHAHNLWQANVAEESIDINLHGHFGDLLFGGSFINHVDVTMTAEEKSLDTFQRRWGGAFLNLSEYRSHCVSNIGWSPDEVHERFHASFKPFADLPDSMASDLFALQYHGRKQIQYYIVHNRPWFEARTPFLDLNLLRFLYRLPTAYRHNRRLQIAVLKRLNTKLAAVPRSQTLCPASANWITAQREKFRSRIDRFIVKPLIGKKLWTPHAPVFNDMYSTWIATDLDHWLREKLFAKSSVVACLFRDGFFEQAFNANLDAQNPSNRSVWIIGTTISLELLAEQVKFWNV